MKKGPFYDYSIVRKFKGSNLKTKIEKSDGKRALIRLKASYDYGLIIVTKIEYSMQEKQFALAVFMDIQGAFDSTTFAAI